jgi:pimeloyl-ACP methyl ester carboxylesterase
MLLPVPGATIYYETVGSGPLLLVLQGGAGDAGGSAGLVKHLKDRYTLLSYDRRGLTRSPVADRAAPTSIVQHADDVSRVLAALTQEPVFAVGISIGAVIGLELMRTHPGQLRGLVAHEAPVPSLLPPDLYASAAAAQKQVEEAYARDGLAAMQLFMKMTGFSMADRESDLEMPRINPSYADNMTFFLTHDTKAARDHALDVDALKGRPIAVGAGTTSRGLWIHVCAEQLAARLKLPLNAFPGGHNGYAFHPRGFSAKLDDVLRTF